MYYLWKKKPRNIRFCLHSLKNCPNLTALINKYLLHNLKANYVIMSNVCYYVFDFIVNS